MANELYREIRRRERAARKAEFSTLLAKALAAGRWECDACGGEDMLSRIKCTSAPPSAVDIVGMMRARTQKETGVRNKRSAGCLKPSVVAGSTTKRRCAGVGLFTINLAAGTRCRGGSKAFPP